jgi:hypothetical protein
MVERQRERIHVALEADELDGRVRDALEAAHHGHRVVRGAEADVPDHHRLVVGLGDRARDEL